MAGSATPMKRKHHGDSKAQAKRARGASAKKPENMVDRTLVSSEPLETTNSNDAMDVETVNQADWVVSKPAGGRMADIDPLLTTDQRFLIVPYTTSIQVYSTSDSLLVRRIPIPCNTRTSGIVALRQSLLDSSLLWVASASGDIYKIDWTGEKEEPIVSTTITNSGSASGLSTIVVSVGPNGKQSKEEVVLVSEIPSSDFSTRISAYTSTLSLVKYVLELDTKALRFHTFEAHSATGVIYGSIHRSLYVGSPQALNLGDITDLAYDFYTFACDDIITSTDARAIQTARPKKNSAKSTGAVDIVVGCARGPIYVYSDILSRLQALDKAKTQREALQPKKLHWHRRAVHSVKWSRDGNYLVSGGSEHTLVLWQLDTNKQNFLPHLTGIVENITVSASGAAYAVHLDDNSVMVLSSAQLEPTAYVSGIQSSVYVTNILKEHLVPRMDAKYVVNDINVLTALSPATPEKLYICVGDGLYASRNGSKPYLQTVDISSMRSVGKQAIARSSLTANNQTPAGGTIIDPEIKHMKFSCDGKWLATVDEWSPPAPSDVQPVSAAEDASLRETRREVFLKIWDASLSEEGNEPKSAVSSEPQFALVSRINAPHETDHPEGVLDLASDPQSPRFATLGHDGAVRIWKPRPRQRDGLAVTDDNGREMYTWVCDTVVSLVHRPDAVNAVSVPNERLAEGRLSFSDDGSCLVAAFGAGDEGSVYILDTYTGAIRYSWDDLWRGTLHGLALMGAYVIVLSHDLRVFDMVSDSLVYGLPILKTTNLDSAAGAANIAVDHVSNNFAVSFRHTSGSELLVFTPESMEPLVSHHFNSRIASLAVSADSQTSGFLILDDEAQLYTVSQPSNDAALVVARSLDDMQLQAGGDVTMGAVVDSQVDMDEASDDEDQKEDGADAEMSDAMDVDEDGTAAHPAVIGQHQLADIFNAAPAYAMAPMEDIFRQVACLLANGPASS